MQHPRELNPVVLESGFDKDFRPKSESVEVVEEVVVPTHPPQPVTEETGEPEGTVPEAPPAATTPDEVDASVPKDESAPVTATPVAVPVVRTSPAVPVTPAPAGGDVKPLHSSKAI